MQRSEQRRRLRELKERRQEIFRRIHESRYNEQVEMRRQLHELEERMDALHGGRRHRNPFERNLDFKHYYRQMRRTRFVFLFANVTLWTLLFALSGPATALKVVILVLALITTTSNVFELLFLLGVKNRVLNPVESLKRGVAEIMKGNYTVVVDPNTHSEVSDLIDAFNDMARKLYENEKLSEEYEQNRKQLIAGISHDLKTPITSIQGYIDAIRDQKDLPQEKLDKYLTIIRNNAAYMNRLIDDLFLFSKLDLQKLEFNFEETDLGRYMADLMEEFRLEMGDRRARLEYADELTAPCRARLDAKRFHQAVRNIIDNAVKYGPEEGLVIRARLYAGEGVLCLDIADNGPGIPEDKLGRVFDRFYRLDAERTKDTSSTGLGLAIARELVTAHGGSIGAASGEGRGTCFTIRLPALPGDQGAEHEERADH